MRKGTTLVLLAAMALLAAACLPALGSGQAMAATIELTDSGAPSAIVIFPVGEQPNPKAAAMPPVAFNHVIHEKWMEKHNRDCMVCHHTGDPVACTTCHTVGGSADGEYVTLHAAMHTPTVARRPEDTPSSCVSCHIKATTIKRNCAGCHKQLVKGAREKNSWCAVCHTITPAMTQAQMASGMANRLPMRQNERLGVATVTARKQTEYWSPMIAPYKVDIGTLSETYEPCIFNHRQHVKVLVEAIGNNKLAGAFHTQPATVCITCHHRSPASETPPKCSSCHSRTINMEHPDRPTLVAAYHLQCMNCHKDMKVARPRSGDCETCHKLRPAAVAEK